jgi:transcriptional regulator GlxA family with amidase domain
MGHTTPRALEHAPFDALAKGIDGTSAARPLLRLPTFPASRNGGRKLAVAAREALGLGHAPIRNLVELVETHVGAQVTLDALPARHARVLRN